MNFAWKISALRLAVKNSGALNELKVLRNSTSSFRGVQSIGSRNFSQFVSQKVMVS